MIKSICMKDCATYDSKGEELADCKAVNYIYGANGSGKSTISNFLMNPLDSKYKECTISWDRGVEEDIIVYNRKFKEENFSKTEIDGVFTIGKASIEEQNALKRKKKDFSNKIEEKRKANETQIKLENEYIDCEQNNKNVVWNNILKKYEKEYAQAFTGCRNSKEKFYAEVNKRYDVLKEIDFDIQELPQRAHTLFGERPNTCELLEFNIKEEISKIELIEKNAIWKTAIVGSKDVPIGELIHKLHSNDWISEGRMYIEDGSDVCPFCQHHTIDESFKKQLEDFFDDTYKSQIKMISDCLEDYENAMDYIVKFLNEMKVSEDIVSIGKMDKELLLSKIELLKQVMDKNKQKMLKKKSKPEIKIEFEKHEKIVSEIYDIQRQTNNNIKTHNNLVQDLNNSKKRLVDDVWTYVLNEQKQLLIQLRKGIEDNKKARAGIGKKLEDLEETINCLKLEIEEIGKNVTSVQPTVDEINRVLEAYGFNNFKIVSSKTKEDAYQIQRGDGTLASNTLSEGEETFISFLYFMQMSKGSIDSSKVFRKKVLILDDPICSLDSTILYIVSAMVKDLARQVKNGESDVSQIFILTHNVFFHKEASFLDGRQNNKDRNVNYWIISKDKNVSTIRCYGMTNPITTAYEMLWAELRDSSANTSLITTQNIMRRIIENYFGMLGNGKEAFIEARFDSAEDAMICKSLFYWINDGSHMITDDLYIDSYTDSIDRYKEVFKQIFIKTGNEAHYNMMMKKDISA